MSKLLTEPKNGYVKPKDGASSGIYPKTLVEAVYWDKKKMTLEEALEGISGAASQKTYHCALEEVTNPQEGDICITPEVKTPLTVDGSYVTINIEEPCAIVVEKTSSEPLPLDQYIYIQNSDTVSIMTVGNSTPFPASKDVTPGTYHISDYYGLRSYLAFYTMSPRKAYEYLGGEWIKMDTIAEAIQGAESAQKTTFSQFVLGAGYKIAAQPKNAGDIACIPDGEIIKSNLQSPGTKWLMPDPEGPNWQYPYLEGEVGILWLRFDYDTVMLNQCQSVLYIKPYNGNMFPDDSPYTMVISKEGVFLGDGTVLGRWSGSSKIIAVPHDIYYQWSITERFTVSEVAESVETPRLLSENIGISFTISAGVFEATCDLSSNLLYWKRKPTIIQSIEENAGDDINIPSVKAVANAIKNAGGGEGGSCPLNILVTEENLAMLQPYGPTTRSGLAEYFGVTEGQLQDLLDRKYCGLVGPDNIVFWLCSWETSEVTLEAPSRVRAVSNPIEIYGLGENEWAFGYVWD